ncbi:MULTISPECIES: YceD family protein [Lichenihabitans]|uniref:YceD family protein n=1 Tax=Lichenihabitans TaxID=2723776 RepID=UPI001036B1A3|nr:MULTISPECIES: DUF177 domain-containing protein [Lichenihabitans]UDL95078.1 DUF177 domain-containing protein [Lichenihabitans sp. PAMC28606]
MSEANPVPLSAGPTLIDSLGSAGLRVVQTATAEERSELARLNGLVDITSLTATLLVRAEGRGGAWVTGSVVATIVQTCVISLDSFETNVVEPVDVHFLPEADLDAYRAALLKRGPDPAEDEQEEDEPDLLINGRIDLGALTAEALTLGLDPYPKKPGVEFKELSPPEPDVSPFAALKSLDLRKS